MQKSNDYQVVENETLSYENFEENQVWKNHALLANNQVLYVDDYLKYINLKTGLSVPLCTATNCEHNTEDCMARIAFDFSEQFLYCFGQKLYIGGMKQNAICFYCTDMDGSNHEKVAQYQVNGEVKNCSFYVYDSSVYIALGIADNSEVEMLENGYMSDAPVTIQLLSFDFSTQEFREIYQFPEVCYQANVELRYIIDGKLYYDFTGDELPFEKMYSFETWELVSPEYEKYVMKEVGAIYLEKGEREVVTEYQVGDYIGYKDNHYYFLDFNEDYILSGDIRVVDFDKEVTKTVNINKIENRALGSCGIHVLTEGFVVSIQDIEDDPGTMYFYNENAKQTQVIEDCSLYVIGEYQNRYLLGVTALSESMVAYVAKEDVEKMRKKCVYIIEEDEI